MSFKIIGIGEVLWDLLPAGREMGGAPANFAYHANALGASAQVITRLGTDTDGRELLQRFERIGLPTALVQKDATAPTGTAGVALAAQGVPTFTIQENVAWDNLEAPLEAITRVRESDAVCFGSLAQRSKTSRESIQRLVAAAGQQALRVFDINLRQAYYSPEIIVQSLGLANVLKLNEDELAILAKMLGLPDSPEEQVARLSKDFALRLVALTRGANGSLLYQQGRWSEQRPRAVQIVDTVGAGDSFSAALVLGLLLGRELDEIHAAAAEVAGYVCSCAGATPPLPQSISKQFVG
jgi:fructokinase